MKKFVFAAATAAAAFASPALAQDATTGSGPFIGALVGYDHPSISYEGESEGSDGLLYGAVIGYDYMSGNMMAGVEAEISDSTAGVEEGDVFSSGDTLALDAARDLYIGARLGYQTGARSLVYVKAGYTNTRVALSYDDGVDSFEDSDSIDGFRLGGGFQTELNGLTARVEYRYSSYSEYKYEGVDTGLSADRHQVALIVGKKF